MHANALVSVDERRHATLGAQGTLSTGDCSMTTASGRFQPPTSRLQPHVRDSPRLTVSNSFARASTTLSVVQVQTRSARNGPCEFRTKRRLPHIPMAHPFAVMPTS